jgi:hypothetical protein
MRRLSAMRQQSSALDGLARLALREGALLKAARLRSAAEALRTSAGIAFRETEEHLDIVPALRAALSPEEMAAAWAEGEKLTVDEAVGLGLS